MSGFEGFEPGCARGRGLAGARSVAISADGRSAYVASAFSHAVAVFARDRRTGALTQLPGAAGCASRSEQGCAGGRALAGAQSVAISADGRSAYVASHGSDAVGVFARQRRRSSPRFAGRR